MFVGHKNFNKNKHPKSTIYHEKLIFLLHIFLVFVSKYVYMSFATFARYNNIIMLVRCTYLHWPKINYQRNTCKKCTYIPHSYIRIRNKKKLPSYSNTKVKNINILKIDNISFNSLYIAYCCHNTLKSLLCKKPVYAYDS